MTPTTPAPLTPRARARLDAKVERRGAHWYWLGKPHPKGAGPYFWTGARLEPVRRVLWRVYHQGLLARRSNVVNLCGDPDCIRPHARHNAPVSASERRRRAKFYAPGAKLPLRRVRAIKRRLARGADTLVAIAADEGVTPEAIRQIRDGESWAQVSA